MKTRKILHWALSPLLVLVILYAAFFCAAFSAVIHFGEVFFTDSAFLWRNLGPNCMERRP